jgi:hypothetical protein
MDVRGRALELTLPEVADLAILPLGYERAAAVSGLTIDQEATTLRKLLAEAAIEVQVLGAPCGIPTTIRKSADWVAPILFVGANLWAQNPVAVQIAIDVISSYILDSLKGAMPNRNVRLSFAVESRKKPITKLLTYDGPVEGLKDLQDAIRRLADE